MMKVTLRAYNREIETLIDQGQIEEATAHCMHILKTFPKHLETYRLMGKAYLEAHRYADAADIFQRVLLAVPDDFVSHLGMSIADDERRNLAGAIWHMERAYEINSSNAGIQNELRRLYGRRDGVEPTRINRTRAALAHIYLKSGEFQQALTEIKAVLVEDGTRTDMKTLQARAFFLAGRKNEAVEVCIELLKLYPYSLEGNRILVEILPGTSMAQGIDQYQRRIRSLDPYAIPGSAYNSLAAPDETVMIEHIDWEPGQNPRETTDSPSSNNSPQQAAEPAAEIPDWMKQSGWGPSSGESEPEKVQPAEPEPATPAAVQIAAAEIPDWLKAMAPPEAAADPAPAPAVKVAADQPNDGADLDWFASLGAPAAPASSAAAQEIPTPQETPAPAGTTNLDWLNSIPSATSGDSVPTEDDLGWLNELGATPEKPTAPAAAEPPNVPNLAVPAAALPVDAVGNIPAWLKNMEAEPTEVKPAAVVPAAPETNDTAENIPDWLKDMTAEPAAAVSPSTPGAEDLPAWIKEPPAEPDSFELPAVGSADDWLKDIPENPAAAKPDSASSETNNTDWMNELMGTSAAGMAASGSAADWFDSSEETPSNQENMPAAAAGQPQSEDWWDSAAETTVSQNDDSSNNLLDRLGTQPDFSAQAAEPAGQPVQPSAQNPGEIEQEEAFKWLDSLISGQAKKTGELITPPAAEPIETSPSLITEQPAEEAPLSALVSGPGTSASEQDDALAWLESLAQKQGAKPEELITPPADRTDTAPSWVNEQPAEQPAETDLSWLTGQPAEEAPLSALVSGPGTSASEQDDALAWLESLAQKQGAKPEELITPPADRTDTAPSWVAELPEEQPAEQASTEEAPLSALVSGPGTSTSEQDDALAWLESLAQKQGAKPEELITPPADRSDTAPSWVTEQPAEQPAAQAPAEPAETDLSWLTEQPVEQASTEEASLSALVSGPGTSTSEQDDALAWLESLAQKQGAKSEELITPPADRSETAPSWVTEQPAEQGPAAQVPAEQPAETDLSWLTEQPAEEAPLSALVSGPGTSASEQDDALAWLESLAQKQGAKPEELITPPADRSDTAPSWVAEQPAEQPAAQAPAEPAETDLSWLTKQPVEQTSTDEAPLSALVSGPGTSASEQDDALAWLESLAQKQGAKPEELITPPADRSETAPSWVTEQPAEQPAAQAPAEPAETDLSWLTKQPVEQASTEEAPLSALVSGPGTSEAEQDDALAWLESLAQKQGAKPEELITPPADRSETAPSWVAEQPAEQPAEQAPAVQSPAEPAETDLSWLTEQPTEEAPLSALVSGPGTSASEQDDALAWLESLAQKQGDKPEELITPPADRSETAPSWVAEQPAEQAPAAQVPAGPAETDLSWLTEQPVEQASAEEAPLSALVSGPGTSEAEQDDALAWLESLAQKQGAKPEELITPPADRSETAPSWVAEQPAEQPAEQAPAVQSPAEPAEADLSWLTEQPAEQASAAPSEATPSWFAEQAPKEENPLAELGEDDMAWLESLNPQQAAKPEDAPLHSLDTSGMTPPASEAELTPTESSQGETAKISDTQPHKIAPVIEAQTQAVPESKSVEDDSLSWLGELSPADTQPHKVAKQPDLKDLGTASAGFADALAADEDFDWLGDLGKPVETSSNQPTIRVEPASPEARPVISALPDTPDVSLDWLTNTSRAAAPAINQPGTTEPLAAETSTQEPVQPAPASLPGFAPTDVPAKLDESSDWFTSLEQPDGSKTSEPMPWEQEAAAKNPAPADLEPVSSSLMPVETAVPAQLEPEPAPSAADQDADWLGSLTKEEEPQAAAPLALEATPAAETAQVEPESAPIAADQDADWLASLANEEEPQAAAPLALEATPAAETAQIEPEPAPIAADQDADWLASLANEEEPQAAAPLALEATPAAETAQVEAEAAPNIVDHDTDWLASLARDEEPQAAAPLALEPAPTSTQAKVEPEPASSSADQVADWLASLAKDEEPQTVTPSPWEPAPISAEHIEPEEDSTPAETEGTIPAASMSWELESTSEKIPDRSNLRSVISDWVKDQDEPEEEPGTPASIPPWVPMASTIEPPAEREIEELPDWLKDPTVEEQPAEIRKHAAAARPLAETAKPAPTLPAAPSTGPARVTHPQPAGPPQAHAIPLGNDKDAQTVQKARDLLISGGLDDAMSEYSKLIKKGKLLEEAIFDLQEAVYKHPVDVIIWQTLGDAYFRANRLQEALDAYSKAEGLLR